MKTQLRLYSLDQLKNDQYYHVVFSGLLSLTIGVCTTGEKWKESKRENFSCDLLGFIEEIEFKK